MKCWYGHAILGALLCSPFLSVAPSNASAEVIFSDNFGTGDLSYSESGFKWTNRTRVEVVPENAYTGTHAARFRYPGSPDPEKDAWAELRFDLGAWYPELWIQYHLFIPENYVHRGESWSNNKFLRVWGTDYDDLEKVGFSLFWNGEGGSDLNSEWNTGTGIGTKVHRTGAGDGFITDADRGEWIEIKVQLIASGSEEQPGTIRLWKNDELVINHENMVKNYDPNAKHAYRYGYILGWANSGFTETTDLYVDNIVFATTAEALRSMEDVVAAPKPPGKFGAE